MQRTTFSNTVMEQIKAHHGTLATKLNLLTLHITNQGHYYLSGPHPLPLLSQFSLILLMKIKWHTVKCNGRGESALKSNIFLDF